LDEVFAGDAKGSGAEPDESVGGEGGGRGGEVFVLDLLEGLEGGDEVVAFFGGDEAVGEGLAVELFDGGVRHSEWR